MPMGSARFSREASGSGNASTEPTMAMANRRAKVALMNIFPLGKDILVAQGQGILMASQWRAFISSPESQQTRSNSPVFTDISHWHDRREDTYEIGPPSPSLLRDNSLFNVARATKKVAQRSACRTSLHEELSTACQVGTYPRNFVADMF